jgi:hypothetical protein
MNSTKAIASSITGVAASVVGIGKALTSALGGNFQPIMKTVLGAVMSFAKVLFLIPGFLIALVNPMNVAKMAMANFSTAISASSPAAFVAATRNMAPAMKDAVMSVRLLEPQLKNLYGIIQQGFWLGFSTDINSLARVYFPLLGSGLGGIASVLGNLRHELVLFFLQPQVIAAIQAWMTAFGGLGSPILHMIEVLLPTMITLFTDFATILTTTVIPVVTTLASWFAHIMTFITPILTGVSSIVSGTASGGAAGSASSGGGFFSGLISGVSGFFSSLFGRASGGAVMGGQSYRVGERGPEILSLGGASSGTVTPAASGHTFVTVKIGETELRGMVSTEIHNMIQGVALAARSGRGLIN